MMNSDTLRPGGLSLTKKMLSNVSITDKKIVDVGCGSGATVGWLRKQEIEAYGIDCSIQTDEERFLYQSSAEAMPFDDQSVDIVLMECSLSVLDQPEQSLRECKRILVPSGYFIISDLFARGNPAICQGILGHIQKWEAIRTMIENIGFRLESFQEEEGFLRSYFAKLIFDSSDAELETLGLRQQSLKGANSSYFVAVFRA